MKENFYCIDCNKWLPLEEQSDCSGQCKACKGYEKVLIQEGGNWK